MSDFIMQMRPWFGEEERRAITDYMLSDGFLTEYKNTKLFEEQIAEFTGVKNCIVVNNGTISLTLAALALGIGQGDEVLVPNYTMIATPNSMKLIGAEPIFIDVEKSTLCMDFNKLEESLTSKTRAMIIVSANGRFPTTDIEKYIQFSNQKGLHVIEDAAQSLGSYYPDKQHIGSKGSIGSFSFSMPKIITTGQGGALITDDDNLAMKLRKLKDFGRSQGGLDVHDSIGFNSKFTELQAVIGLEQVKKIEFRMKRKKEIWLKYQANLSNVNEVTLFEHNLEFTTPWFIDSLCNDRDRLLNYLNQNSVGSRVMYPPLNRQACYNKPGHFPVSDEIGEKGLWLPSYAQLADEQINFVTDKIKTFYH